MTTDWLWSCVLKAVDEFSFLFFITKAKSYVYYSHFSNYVKTNVQYCLSLTFYSNLYIPVIEKGNWESLPSDLKAFLPDTQFDAIFCLGNSFAHVLDKHGDQRTQKLCLQNFNKCLKPGGLLVIDHRNFDDILNGGSVPNHSIYFDVSLYLISISMYVLYA